jgi:hypothetical protein
MTMLCTQGINVVWSLLHAKVSFMVPDEVTGSCVNGFRNPELQQWVIDIV